MLIIDSPSDNAYFNIASEEYLLEKYPNEEIFLLYVNAPAIIVGRFQNTLAEINLDFVEANHIKVVRRLSGGGAVYHDLGNLNFSFHTLSGNNDFNDFSKFTQPVIDLLYSLNVPAKLEGRNDLTIDGKKFSGNAKLSHNGKTVQHGTILINSEMEVLSNALKVNPLKFKDKAVKSARARVTNLVGFLPEGTTSVNAFKKLLIEQIIRENSYALVHELSENEIIEIQKLAEDKYASWNWNYGKSPVYNFNRAIKVSAGFIEIHLDVRQGIIQNAKIFGDFFASQPIDEFEKMLIGQKHEIQHLMKFLSTIKYSNYLGSVELFDLLELFE